MFRLMVLEYQRFCHHLGMVGGCLAKVLLISVLAGQLVMGQQEVVWLLIPLFAWSISPCYRAYLQKDLVGVLLDSHVGWSSLRMAQCMLSVGLNLWVATILSFVFGLGVIAGIVCWLLLDMLGIVLHSVHCLSSQSSGVVVSYFLVVPLAYPWVIWGMMAGLGSIAAMKLILAGWLLAMTFGMYFYVLCFQIGGR